MLSNNSQEGRLSRRQLLQLGGIGAIGLGLPELLCAASPGSQSRNSRSEAEASCIFIVQYGGCSHIDSFDLKPGGTSRNSRAASSTQLLQACRARESASTCPGWHAWRIATA